MVFRESTYFSLHVPVAVADLTAHIGFSRHDSPTSRPTIHQNLDMLVLLLNQCFIPIFNDPINLDLAGNHLGRL